MAEFKLKGYRRCVGSEQPRRKPAAKLEDAVDLLVFFDGRFQVTSKRPSWRRGLRDEPLTRLQFTQLTADPVHRTLLCESCSATSDTARRNSAVTSTPTANSITPNRSSLPSAQYRSCIPCRVRPASRSFRFIRKPATLGEVPEELLASSLSAVLRWEQVTPIASSPVSWNISKYRNTADSTARSDDARLAISPSAPCAPYYPSPRSRHGEVPCTNLRPSPEPPGPSPICQVD